MVSEQSAGCEGIRAGDARDRNGSHGPSGLWAGLDLRQSWDRSSHTQEKNWRVWGSGAEGPKMGHGGGGSGSLGTEM